MKTFRKWIYTMLLYVFLMKMKGEKKILKHLLQGKMKNCRQV